MKYCSKCDDDKPLDAFGKNMGRDDGLQHWCRSCMGAYKQTDEARARRRKRDRERRLAAAVAAAEETSGLLTPDQRLINALRETLGLDPLYQRTALEALRRPGALEPHTTSGGGALAPGCRWIKAAL